MKYTAEKEAVHILFNTKKYFWFDSLTHNVSVDSIFTEAAGCFLFEISISPAPHYL